MGWLFAYGDIHEELGARLDAALNEVRSAPDEFVIAADPRAWGDALTRANGASAPVLQPRQLKVSAPVDVRIARNPPGVEGAVVVDRSGSDDVAGESVDIYIYVEGEVDLLRLQLSNVRGLPRVEGLIDGEALVHTITY